MSYITESGLRALDAYAYKPGVASPLDNVLKPFWLFAASKLPRWMAPNVVTLTGTAFLISILPIVVIYDPHLEGEVPPLGYFYLAWCVWAYQTLDAMDGAHARATGSSSPLGQLFDHGCDAFGTTPLALAMCSAMGLGTSKWTLLLFASIQIPFWFCQFEEHFAHTLRTQVMNFGVTEGQYLIAFTMLCTACFGVNIWSYTLFMAGDTAVELKHAGVLMGCIFPAIMLLTSCLHVYNSAGFQAFLQVIPLALIESLLVWIATSPSLSHIFLEYTIPLLVIFGILFTHLSNVMIISTVCHMSYPVIHPIMLPIPVVFFALAYLQDPGEQLFVLAVFGSLVLIQYTHYVLTVAQTIADHLNINVLSLGPRRPVSSQGQEEALRNV